MKIVLCLAILATSAVWADEAADRAAIETTLSALNRPQSPPSDIFTADFPNAAELQRLRDEAGRSLTVIISREPMGEATWYPGSTLATRFVTRSVTFVAPDSAVVVAGFGRETVLFVVKSDGTKWRIASFRVLPEAQGKAPL